MDFKAVDGKPLAKDCSDADLTTAANSFAFAEMHTAYKGAVTTFFSKNGVELARVPASNPAAQSAPQLTRAEFLKLEPAAQTAFFANKGKIVG